MLRAFLLAAGVILATVSTGCVGMGRGGYGVGLPCDCGDCGGCGDCGSCGGMVGHGVGGGPISSFHNWRRNLVCGGGCGEVYYGDWTNYPPDCCDACDNQVAHGNPYQPLNAFRATSNILTGLYGRRHCDQCETGCDDCGCSSGYQVDGHGHFDSHGHIDSNGGCATCGGHATNSNIMPAEVHVSPKAMVATKKANSKQPAGTTMAKRVYYDQNAKKQR